MLEVLIPTYNRSAFLRKNLELINDEVAEYGLEGRIRVLVSDNSSTDDTSAMVDEIRGGLKYEVQLYTQAENIGLEKNAVFLLDNAVSNIVMYLGDDDYLGSGYLRYAYDTFMTNPEVSCMVSGIDAVFKDGRKTEFRYRDGLLHRFKRGVTTVLRWSYFGHQLSGLTFRRAGVFDSYTRNERLRNIYPFVFFLAFNMLRGKFIYADSYRTKVTADNSKDWDYDSSGLVSDFMSNYEIVFDSRWLESIAFLQLIRKQSWRLGIGKSLHKTRIGISKFITNDSILFVFKVVLCLYLPVLFLEKVWGKLMLKEISQNNE